MNTVSTDELVSMALEFPDPTSTIRRVVRELLVRRDHDEWVLAEEEFKPPAKVGVLGVLEDRSDRWVQEVYWHAESKRWHTAAGPTPFPVLCWKTKPLAPRAHQVPSVPWPATMPDPLQHRKR